VILLLLLCYNTYFNNLFLHSLHKSHCIRPSSGQAVANSALGSKRLATPGRSRYRVGHYELNVASASDRQRSHTELYVPVWIVCCGSLCLEVKRVF